MANRNNQKVLKLSEVTTPMVQVEFNLQGLNDMASKLVETGMISVRDLEYNHIGLLQRIRRENYSKGKNKSSKPKEKTPGGLKKGKKGKPEPKAPAKDLKDPKKTPRILSVQEKEARTSSCLQFLNALSAGMVEEFRSEVKVQEDNNPKLKIAVPRLDEITEKWLNENPESCLILEGLVKSFIGVKSSRANFKDHFVASLKLGKRNVDAKGDKLINPNIVGRENCGYIYPSIRFLKPKNRKTALAALQKGKSQQIVVDPPVEESQQNIVVDPPAVEQ